MKSPSPWSFFLKIFFSTLIALTVGTLNAQPPSITSFSPTSGPIGTTVTITGTNFSTTAANNIVWFGAVRATVTAATTTELTVTVPTGTTFKPISVTVNGLSAYSGSPFSVTFSSTRVIDANSFASRINCPSGMSPYSAAISDIDGDGKPDLVVTNINNNTISVFQNNGTSYSSFYPQVEFTTGLNPHGIAVEDLDGDGKPDLVVANGSDNTVSVFRNTSTTGFINSSSFATRVDFATGTNPFGVAIGDIDGDGKPDIVVANGSSNTISVLRNTSISGSITAGSFASKVDFPAEPNGQKNTEDIAIGDIDGDGKPDMVVANFYAGTISVYRNTSTPASITTDSFEAKVNFSTGMNPLGIAIGDIDGDGKQDLVVANNGSNTLSLFHNTSSPGSITSGSFSSRIDLTTGSEPYNVTIGDIDGDAKPDLAVVNNSSNSVTVFRNTCTLGSIQASSFNNKFDFPTGSAPYDVIVGDVNSDGKPDLSVVNLGSNNVSVLKNALPLPVPPVITSFTPTSGPIGTIVSITGSNFSITTANNIVWFGAVQATVTAATATQLTVTVPTGETYQPITVTVNGLTAYSSLPFNVTFPSTHIIDSTAFAAKVDFTAETQPEEIATGDIDGDGKPDLVIANVNSNIISVYRNTSAIGSISSGSFATKINFNIGTNPKGIALGDIDGDGKLDLVVTNPNNYSVSVLRNTSTVGSITAGSFATKVDFTGLTNPYSVAIGDIDGDGKPDLVVTNWGVNTISVFRNTSISGSIATGSFAARIDFSTGTNPYSVIIGDIDGDGKPDLIVTNEYGNTVSVFRNNSTAGSIGAGSLEPRVDFTTVTTPRKIAIGDLDGDGKPDLVVTNWGFNTISVFRNTSTSGSITTSSLAAKVDFTTVTNPVGVAIGDIDGDGRPDLVVSNGGNTVSAFRNTSTSGSIMTGSFSARVNFTTGTSPISIALCDIDGDGKPDITVANSYDNTISVLRNTISVPMPPIIASFTPTSGPIDTTVTITGTNFSTTAANNIVWFGAVRATVTAATSTSLSVKVPMGATYQPITVTVAGLTAYSKAPFIVTFPGTRIIDASAFAPKVDFTAGTNPWSVAIGDIDRDGKPDLAVANTTSGSVSVFRNTSTSGSIGTGSFAVSVDLPTGSNPYGVAIGDIDGDGKLDLAIANNNSNTVSIFRNSSSSGAIAVGSFDARVDITTVNGPQIVAIADLDGDGKPELIVTGGNSVSVFKNNSTSGSISASSFAARVDFTTGSNAVGVAIEDIDGDGKSDIVVANFQSNTVSVLRNTSTSGSITAGSFAPGIDFPTGMNPWYIVFSDIDGDDKPDLAVTNYSGNTVSIFRNTSTSGFILPSSFADRVDFTTGSNPLYVAIGDIDGDNKPDLAVANATNGTVSVLRNTSNPGSITSGSFATKIDIATGAPNCVAIGDIDGDSKPDLVVTNNGNNNVSVLRNTISTSVPPVITSFTPTSGPIGTTVTITGTNFSTTAANNIVWFGAVKATVTAVADTQLTVTVPTGATYQPITVTVNGLTAYSRVPFNVTFTSSQIIDASAFASKVDFTTGTQPEGIAIGDIDGDNKPDLVFANSTGNNVSVYRNISSSGAINSSSFAAKVDFFTGAGPRGIALGDIDGDGKLDLVVANNNGNVSVFRNTSTSGSIGAGSFSNKVDFSAGSGPNEVKLEDIDRDGKPDLIVSNWANNTVSVFRNTCTSGSINPSSFSTRVDFPTAANPIGIALGDIDGDGKLDLTVVNNGSNTVSVFRNTSTFGSIDANSFATQVEFATGSPWGVNIVDIDGDGKLDLVVTNNGLNSISLFRNISTSGTIAASSFASKVDFTTLNNPDHITVGDIDGDGKPDLAVTDFGSAMVSIFRNTSSTGSITAGSLSARVDFQVGTNPRGIVICDIDGDSKPDIIVTNNTNNTVSVFHNTISLNAPVPPVITSFTPTSGPVGTTVTITGTNFSTTAANNNVWFGAVKATVTAATATQLTIIVPTGATNQNISVTINGLTAYSSTIFTVTPSGPPPVITSFNPISDQPGYTVTITGTNFSTTPSNNIVWFGAVRATVLSATATQLTVSVPVGASYQPITVTVNGLTAYSGLPFNCIFPGIRNIDATTLTSKVDFPANPGSWSDFTEISDIDGDGKPDLIFGNTGVVSIYRNISIYGSISAGSLGTRVDLNTGGSAMGIAVGDIDGDGKPDIAVANQSNKTISVFRNNSTPGSITTSSFDARVDIYTGIRPQDVAIGDIDGDGKPDLAVVNYGVDTLPAASTLSVLRNTGSAGLISSGSFTGKVDFTTGFGPIKVAINDIDGDGKPDIIITRFSGGQISVFRNTATSGSITSSSLASKVDFNMGMNPYGFDVGDLDGDGKLDLAVVNSQEATISVLMNTSSSGSITKNSFASKVDFTTGPRPYDVAIGDIDGDCRPDMVVANQNWNTISLFKNVHTPGPITTNSFSSKVDFISGNGPSGLAIGDLDGDGKPEIVVRSYYNGIISVFRNSTITPNPPVIASINPTSGPVGSTVTINGANFSQTPEDNIVMFGDAQATVTAASQNQLTVLIPIGADGQSISVTVYGQIANFNVSFTVTTPQNIDLESAILTLNGDGINERLVFKYFEIYGHSSFYVYNSRGALIYSKKDYQNDWDLTINGHLLETGGYFYVIETDLGVFRGSFSILR